MNSRIMMVLAGVLVVAAIGVGYLGVSIGRGTPEPAAEPVPVEEVDVDVASVPVSQPMEAAQDPRLNVVVLARDVPAYHTIQTEDLQVEQLRLMPPGSFTEPTELLGRRVWRGLPAGSVLTESSFESGGPIARMIRPGERALAIQFNQLMGAGGHLVPGDYVDALMFLPEDELNTDRTVQVAVPALRVLSVGDELGLATSGEPINAPPPLNDEAENNQQAVSRTPSRAETAVLAIPEGLLTRFALAAEVGQLRLAVRAAEEGRLAHYYAGQEEMTETLNQQLFQFEKFALNQAERPQPGLVTESKRAQPVAALPSPQASQGGRAGSPSVPVIRGAVTSLETP